MGGRYGNFKVLWPLSDDGKNAIPRKCINVEYVAGDFGVYSLWRVDMVILKCCGH